MRLVSPDSFRAALTGALEVSVDTSLIDLDSLMLFELLLVMEEMFDCQLDDEVLSRATDWESLYSEYLKVQVR